MKRTKGNAKNSKLNNKVNAPKKAVTVELLEERKCPVHGCDSMGSLGGLSEKHFTQEACPFYHNVPLDETKSRRTDRLQYQEQRDKAAILFDPMSNVTSVDEKAYQMKIKEFRANFVRTATSPVRHHPNQNSNPQEKEDRKQKEPYLKGYVPEYDLKLFQEAQAVASEKIENDLLKWPPERGTK